MKTLFQRIFDGNDAVYGLAVQVVDETIAKIGADAPIGFHDTAYSLPCIYAMTGKKIETVGQAKEVLETVIKSIMTRNNRTKDIFTSGVATAAAAEIIEATKWAVNGGNNPYEEPFTGHFTDAQVRELVFPWSPRTSPVSLLSSVPLPPLRRVLSWSVPIRHRASMSPWWAASSTSASSRA